MKKKHEDEENHGKLDLRIKGRGSHQILIVRTGSVVDQRCDQLGVTAFGC